MKFRSLYKSLIMRLDPTEVRTERGGQIIMERQQGESIEFRDNKYETADEKKIEFLKTRAAFGIEIFEIVEAAQAIAGETPATHVVDANAPVEVPVGTVNSIITYLVTEKKADQSAFVGLKKDELIAYALTTFNVKFI